MGDDSNVSTRDKGDRNETEAGNILSRVYGKSTVDKVDRYGVNDPFGFVDLMAMKKNRKILFVQVKTNRFTAKSRRRYESIAKRKLPSEHARFEVWVRIDYKGWEVHRYNNEKQEFEKVLEMDTCDIDETVEEYRQLVGFYEEESLENSIS
jgi:Holliday junction resolvase-like predicted endonuclease